MNTNTFAELFRKYRLRSEYETLAEFRDALADEGAYYDHTLFSHWQKGTRVPKNRKLLLQVLSVFIKRRAITTIEEANTFFQSAGQGFLSDDEALKFPLQSQYVVPFQVPRKGLFLTGRTSEIAAISADLKAFRTVLLYGQPGVGKTYLAIELGHCLREEFPDGVFWFRLDTSTPQRVLSGIATAYGHEVSAHYSVDRLSEIVRSLIWNKQALFIFDTIQPDTLLNMLLPNSSRCSVLLTANRVDMPGIDISKKYHIKPFAQEESEALFSRIVPTELSAGCSEEIRRITKLVGNLPLAIQIIAKQIVHKGMRIPDVLKKLSQKQISLSSMVYDDKSLRGTLEMGISTLSEVQRQIVYSVAVFSGADFPLEAVVAVSNRSRSIVRQCLDELVELSFLELTTHNRYTLHPLIHTFLIRTAPTPLPYLRALTFYAGFMQQYRKKLNFYKKTDTELETIISLLQWGIQEKKVTEVYTLWKVFREYHWHVGYWKDFRRLAKQLYTLALQKKKFHIFADVCISDMSRLWYYDNDLEAAEQYAKEGLAIAEKHALKEYIAPAKERYGKICIMSGRYDEGISLLNQAMEYYRSQKDLLHESHACRYISEAYVMLQEYQKAETFLKQAVTLIQQHDNENEKTVYLSVLNSHLGVLAIIQGEFEAARIYGERGLQSQSASKSAVSSPHTRSTYLWLNKLVLAVACSTLGFAVESQMYLSEAKKDLKNLGIEDSYHQINTYALSIKKVLKQRV